MEISLLIVFLGAFIFVVLLSLLISMAMGNSIAPTQIELVHVPENGPYIAKVIYSNKNWFEIVSDDGVVWYTRKNGHLYDTVGQGMMLVEAAKREQRIKKTLKGN